MRKLIKYIVTALVVVLPFSSAAAYYGTDNPLIGALSGVIEMKTAAMPYQASLWIEDLADKDSAFKIVFAQDKQRKAASVIKLQIMAVCFQLALEGRLDLEGLYALADEDRTEGSGAIKGIKSGTQFRHIRLIELMTTRSDNTAANALIRIIGMDVMNEYFKKLGCQDTQLNRYILHESRKEGVENYTSARDCALILRGIYNGSCVTPEYSQKMLEFLKKQKVRNRIPRFLPENVSVANKTGTLFGAFHDVGIVYTEKGDFILCSFVQGEFEKYDTAKEYISEIARIVYDYYLGYRIDQPDKKTQHE